MIELRCPACRQSIKLDESFTGRRVACVGCAKEFTVPDLKQLAANKASASPTKPTSPAMSVAKPARPEPTLLDKAKQHRELVVGGLIAVVLGAAGLVVYSSIQSNRDDEEGTPIATRPDKVPTSTTDRSIAATDNSKTDLPTSATPATDNRPTTSKSPAETPNNISPPKKKSDNAPANTTKNKPKTNIVKADPSSRPIVPQASSADYVSDSDILLRHSTELNDWVAVTRGAELSGSVELVLPSPFTSQLKIGREMYSARLLGGTRSRLIGPSEDMPFGFELQRGRLIVMGQRGSEVPGAVLTLVVHGETWRAELLSGNTLFGIEIIPRQPEKFEERFGNDDFTGGVLVVKGSVRLIDQAGKTRVVAGNSWLSLARRDRVAVKSDDSELPQTQLPQPQFRAMPDWLDLDTVATKPANQTEAELFSKLFNPQQPFGEAVKPLLSATDAPAIRLAVECQSLIGNRVALMQSLAAAKHAEVRQAAFEGLRDQMPMTNEDRNNFKEELTEVFGKGAKAIYPLLWGYADEDVRNNKFTCFQLIDWLMNDSLAVRELAWSQISKFATAKYAYKPNGSLRSRRLAIKKWQQHVAQTGSILGDEL